MNRRIFLISVVLAVFLLVINSISFAAPGVEMFYYETDLGGGRWQYDYTFYNISTNDEYLYSVDLLFSNTATITGLPLPSGWNSTNWEGDNDSNYIMAFSSGTTYDIATESSLNGFGFTVDYRAGDISYNAFFDDHVGNVFHTSGVTSLVPEPVSAILFVIGGLTMVFRSFMRKRSLLSKNSYHIL